MTLTILSLISIFTCMLNIWVLMLFYKHVLMDPDTAEGAPRGTETMWTIMFILNVIIILTLILHTTS